MQYSRLTTLLPLVSALSVACGEASNDADDSAVAATSPGPSAPAPSSATSAESPEVSGPAPSPLPANPSPESEPESSEPEDSATSEPDATAPGTIPEMPTMPSDTPVSTPEAPVTAPVAPEPEPSEPEPSEPEPAGPVDCSAIEAAGWDLCDSGPDFCAAVYSDGAGCAAVCAAAGLACAEVWEDAAGCSADTAREALSCGGTEHESDYCVCRGPGAVTPGNPGEPEAPVSEPETPAEPEVPTEPEAPTEPDVPTEPETPTEPEAPQPNVGPRACECETPAGEFGIVNDTIIVGPGQTYDGECQIFRANESTLGNGTQDEGQKPVFRVEDGGTLRNVVLGASAADGIHLYGDVTLENIHWLDIGEDAMTVKESGTVNLDCGSATNGEDKVFQVNAASEIHISNFTASNAGKFMRQNGDTTFEIRVFIDHSDISDMDEVIFRTDSSSSHVTLTNSRYSNLGAGLFIFGDSVVNGNSAQSTVENNQEY